MLDGLVIGFYLRTRNSKSILPETSLRCPTANKFSSGNGKENLSKYSDCSRTLFVVGG